jgi:hypothetical protein
VRLLESLANRNFAKTATQEARKIQLTDPTQTGTESKKDTLFARPATYNNTASTWLVFLKR